MEEPFVTIGFISVTVRATSQEDWKTIFASVIEGVANHEDWGEIFSSVTEGATSQEHWSVVVVAYAVHETESLPLWETEGRSNVGGWNTSLVKRKC
jgi:hypothetical protein